MPIANCFVAADCQPGSDNLIDLWAVESGRNSEHMTINIANLEQALGNNYSIMATLLLPSMWSSADISALQLGLARALAKGYRLAMNQVHVVTNIVDSGMVVEDGQEIKW